MNNNYESVLMVKDEAGKIIGFFRNDMEARATKLYLCNEAGLEDVDRHIVSRLNSKQNEE